MACVVDTAVNYKPVDNKSAWSPEIVMDDGWRLRGPDYRSHAAALEACAERCNTIDPKCDEAIAYRAAKEEAEAKKLKLKPKKKKPKAKAK